jgi:hypothetical protein
VTHDYRVYTTRWNDPHVVEEVPANGLEFTFPLSDHGVCAFSATVSPGSTWRASLSCAMSGILIARDNVPVWEGMVESESQSGPRTFDFKGVEWGAFFEKCPAVARTWSQQNDHAIFRQIIADAQAVPGQNIGVILGTTLGASVSDKTINTWDSTTVEEEFRRTGEAAGGPEWYFAATGTFVSPTRTLVLGDQLGRTTPQAVLEYVESSDDTPLTPPSPPITSALGNLFPMPQAYAGWAMGRRGGNVFAHPARQEVAGSTAAIALGSGSQAAQLRATAQATALLNAGYPLRTKITSYVDVSVQATLQRHANADLAADQGMTSTYTLSTFDDDPDWTQVQRGDVVQVILDTDVYGFQRPVSFQSRLLDLAVHVPDDGDAQVNWTVAAVRSI